jgi:hypothetical protein
VHSSPVTMATIRPGLACLASLALLNSCGVGTLFDAPPSKVIAVTPPRVVETAAASDTLRSSALEITSASQKAAPQWAAQHNPHAAWLTLAATSGTVPDTLGLTLHPAGLPPGTYNDTIAIVPSDRGIATVRVPVELHIVASAPPPPPPPPPPPVKPPVTTSPPKTRTSAPPKVQSDIPTVMPPVTPPVQNSPPSDSVPVLGEEELPLPESVPTE